MSKQFIVNCPHCLEEVFIESLNCGIFRHAVYKSNLEPIPPHHSEADCLALIAGDLVYGCAKPFQIVISDNVPMVQKCDYI